MFIDTTRIGHCRIHRPVPARHAHVRFLEPGHFHATITPRDPNLPIDPSVQLYARSGPERDTFVALVHSFNAGDDRPTDWNLRIHDWRPGTSAGHRAARERRPRRGGTEPKLGAIVRLHAAGLDVLADMPWLTDDAAHPDVEQVSANWSLAMDIMTTRHEPVARLTQKMAADRELFGMFDEQADEPAIDVQSVHHLLTVVHAASNWIGHGQRLR